MLENVFALLSGQTETRKVFSFILKAPPLNVEPICCVINTRVPLLVHSMFEPLCHSGERKARFEGPMVHHGIAERRIVC